MSIKLMDSSVRDGGNVNDWNFGKRAIRGIISNLINAKIDYIEVGYLKDCEYNEKRTLYQTIEQAESNAIFESTDSEYSVMVQVDKWTWDYLKPCTGKIRNIRVSFHKTRIGDGIALCKRVMENGYICHCNPINIMGYSDAELLELLSAINELKPQVFSIVDTFGAMSLDDMRRISLLLHKNLNQEIRIAAHLHENLGLAFALAIEFINQFGGKRDIIIDASLYGIGRVPGNLCIELVARYLNQEYSAGYEVDYIYDAIDEYIASIKKKNPWGYELAYALSGGYNLHRTYAEFLLEKGRLKTKDIRAILASIPANERVIYNQKLIEEMYNDYVFKSFDDSIYVSSFVKLIQGKNIVIVAPGASLLNCSEQVQKLSTQSDTVVFSVNFIPDSISIDCAFFTNEKRLDQQRALGLKEIKTAITSNLLGREDEVDYIFNYASITTFDEDIIEDSVLALLNLINRHMEQSSICYVAGYDLIIDSVKHMDEGMEMVYSKTFDKNKLLREIVNFSMLKIIYLGR